MSPNVKLADLVGHKPSFYNPALTTAESIGKLLDVFQNPAKLNKDVFKATTFGDWRQTVVRFRDDCKSQINQGLEELKATHRQEVIDAMRRDREGSAKQQYIDKLGKVREKMVVEQQGILTTVKEKKFPLQHARVKTEAGCFVSVGRLPDMNARAAAATELAIAASTPLKYINAQLLENYASAGRTDLVSALIERSALNTGEVKDFPDVYAFAQEFYQTIKVAEDRQLYKQIGGIEKYLIAPVSQTMDFDGMRIIVSENIYQHELNTDNLLEM